jgi:general secretion pathway protein B
MSLIYDALRKSEQQRRAGEMPTLATDPGWGVRRTPPPRRFPWLWVAVPCMLLAVAAGAWVWHTRRAAEPATTALAQADGAQADTTADVAAVPGAPAAAPAPPADIAARFAQGETFANDPQALVQGAPAATAGGDAAAAIASPAAAPPPVDPAVAQPSPPPGDVPAASLLATDASMAAPPPPVETTVPPPPAPAEPAPAPPVAAMPQPAPTAPAIAAEPTLPLLYELPYAVRKDMPRLALSMHVYNDDPMRRFAIINDERRAEGDDIEGVRLVAIRRDGIELEYAGQRFLLPRAGG